MSWAALDYALQAFKSIPMTHSAKFVLLALANRHNQETGRCDPSVERIADDMQISHRSVKYGLRELETLKVIQTVERKQRTGRGKKNLTNRYRLFMGARLALGVGQGLPPKQEDNTAHKKKTRPSAFDDLVMSIQDLTEDGEND